MQLAKIKDYNLDNCFSSKLVLEEEKRKEKKRKEEERSLYCLISSSRK